ncbi:hypothetical protein CFOL_v3_14581, partial [Cephalotus follicularis]
IVLSWIMNTVSNGLFGGIVYATDALAVWRDLKESATVLVYFSKLSELWDEYASLVTLPSCGC